MIKFDNIKSSDEKKIERIVMVLTPTIPEQVEGAMEDYLVALPLARKVKDWRITPVINLLESLYVYPQRTEHNELLREVNDLKDELIEERIQRVLSSEKAAKHARKFLGGEKKAPKYSFLMLAALAVCLYLITRRK